MRLADCGLGSLSSGNMRLFATGTYALSRAEFLRKDKEPWRVYP